MSNGVAVEHVNIPIEIWTSLGDKGIARITKF